MGTKITFNLHDSCPPQKANHCYHFWCILCLKDTFYTYVFLIHIVSPYADNFLTRLSPHMVTTGFCPSLHVVLLTFYYSHSGLFPVP